MLEAPVYNMDGKQVDTLKIDEKILGGSVNADLVKQAVLMYRTTLRQGSAKTRSRAEMSYSTKKLFRQKGTGNARRGSRRAPPLRGGGHTFAKRPYHYTNRMPKKMRKQALNSAILAKLLGNDLCVIQDLSIDEPKTAVMAKLLKKLEINRTCVLALGDRNQNIYLSSRNIPDLRVRTAQELNALDVANCTKMIVTGDAMNMLCGKGGDK
jgi:large subunit ribosomal protein L4